MRAQKAHDEQAGDEGAGGADAEKQGSHAATGEMREALPPVPHCETDIEKRPQDGLQRPQEARLATLRQNASIENRSSEDTDDEEGTAKDLFAARHEPRRPGQVVLNPEFLEIVLDPLHPLAIDLLQLR